jgi:UDP-glucose:(heptosyl)LPS alpha-1,3-glucosyltransferase
LDIALCYGSVLPARGGCETYIADLSRRLVNDGHTVHLYACHWDAASLPAGLHYHRLPEPCSIRWMRPWRFGSACLQALAGERHDVSVGFDKTWGQDVLYPQGGLHAASAEHNRTKYRTAAVRQLARLLRWLEPAHWSFSALERRQYVGQPRPLIVVNSNMVRDHFQHYYRIGAEALRVVRSAVDPGRFVEHDRPRRRADRRQSLGLGANACVALFVAMNYRLKGLEPLLHAVRRLPAAQTFRLLVAGNPRTARYERLARRLGIAERVTFLGPQRDIRNCYFAADYLVHPTFYDPCSLVVLEALACGLPVITTRSNGASELLHPPREGFVVKDPHNAEELAAPMVQLLDPAIRTACARAARQAASVWTFEHHYQQLLAVFQEAAARKRAA